MSAGILLGHDAAVAAWAFQTYNKVPIHVDKAIGIIENNQLIGAALFSSYNMMDVHLSYYGTATLTRGIVRCLAQIGLYELRIARCTVIVPNRPSYLLKKLPKFGFRYEGIQRRYYGPTDADRHKGCRFVLFREDIEKLAGMKKKKEVA